MSEFMQAGGVTGKNNTGGQSNRSNSIAKQTKHSMMSAKISPSNSLVGMRGAISNDPTNKSVIEENFKDNDSLHDMKNNRKHKQHHRIIKPLEPPSKPMHDPELD